MNLYLKSLQSKGKKGGQVLKCLVLPNLYQVIQHEIQRKKMTITYNIVKVREPLLFKLKKLFLLLLPVAYPRYLRSDAEHEKEIRKIDYKIDKSLSSTIEGTTTAFVTLNSFHTVYTLMNYYK